MTTKVLQRPTLILNRNWQPVNVSTVARALVLLWNESARVVDPADYQTYTWEDWAARPRAARLHQAVRFRGAEVVAERLRPAPVATPAGRISSSVTITPANAAVPSRAARS
jgi:hypothetical protein